MPSNDSSPVECPPGVHSIFDPCPGDCSKSVEDETKPKGSEGSSPDEPCRCGHGRYGHSMGFCVGEILVAGGTDRENCRCRAFAPAAGETAGEPEAPHEHDWTDWGAVYHGGHFVWRDCRKCGNTESRTEGHSCPEHPEPEAPECESPDGCPDRAACGATCGFADQLKGIRMVPRPEAKPPRRPPYAVAYELEDGTAYEVALPGDATVGSVGGALVITHTSSPVKGLTQARPMEGQ